MAFADKIGLAKINSNNSLMFRYFFYATFTAIFTATFTANLWGICLFKSVLLMLLVLLILIINIQLVFKCYFCYLLAKIALKSIFHMFFANSLLYEHSRARLCRLTCSRMFNVLLVSHCVNWFYAHRSGCRG